MRNERVIEESGFMIACMSIMRGLYREIFGVFVPGAITVCFFIALPMLTYYVLTPAEQFAHTVDMFHSFLNGSNSSLGYFIGTLFVTFSYAIGSVLYRRPLENADAVASLRQWAETKPDARDGLTVQFKKLDEKVRGGNLSSEERLLVDYVDSMALHRRMCCLCRWWVAFKMNWPLFSSRGRKILAFCGELIEYPYPYFRKHLESRGLKGLLKFVDWAPCARSNQEGSRSCCNKNSINVLKYRVRHYGTKDMAMEMDRNECHIRMLNSLWYSFRFIRLAVIICALLVSGYIVFSELYQPIESDVIPSSVSAANAEAIVALTSNTVKTSSITFTVTVSATTNTLSAVSAAKSSKGGSGNRECGVECNEAQKCLRDAVAVWSRHRGRFWALFVMVSLFLGLSYCRRNIEIIFHYVREREIIYILESAEILDREDAALFEDVVTLAQKIVDDGDT